MNVAEVLTYDADKFMTDWIRYKATLRSHKHTSFPGFLVEDGFYSTEEEISYFERSNNWYKATVDPLGSRDDDYFISVEPYQADNAWMEVTGFVITTGALVPFRVLIGNLVRGTIFNPVDNKTIIAKYTYMSEYSPKNTVYFIKYAKDTNPDQLYSDYMPKSTPHVLVPVDENAHEWQFIENWDWLPAYEIGQKPYNESIGWTYDSVFDEYTAYVLTRSNDVMKLTFNSTKEYISQTAPYTKGVYGIKDPATRVIHLFFDDEP